MYKRRHVAIRDCAPFRLCLRAYIVYAPASAAVDGELLVEQPYDAIDCAGRETQNVPPYLFNQALIAAPSPHLPDAVKKAHAGGDVAGIYKLCATPAGEVDAVVPVVSIPGADDVVAETLRQWRIKPQPVGICTLMRFVFRTDATMPPDKR